MSRIASRRYFSSRSIMASTSSSGRFQFSVEKARPSGTAVRCSWHNLRSCGTTRARLMSCRTRQATLLCPTAVAVHDDGDVGWDPPGCAGAVFFRNNLIVIFSNPSPIGAKGNRHGPLCEAGSILGAQSSISSFSFTAQASSTFLIYLSVRSCRSFSAFFWSRPR